jgi:predicted nucleic acid-binding protein
MPYVDTSVVVALLTLEPETAAVKKWFAALDEVPVAADWCVTEVASAFAIKVSTGQLTPTQAENARAAFHSFAQGGLRLVAVSRAAFREAADLASDRASGLRAGDALHLAVAREIGARSIATLDEAMGDNARRIGLGVEAIAG